MNSAIRFISMVTALLFLTQCHPSEHAPIEEDSFAEFANNFENPPAEYSTAPLWVWNDEVTEEKIAAQMQAFKDEYILQVFIHPRMGLITEYLSVKWFELTRFTLKKAEELG